jgi:hypothetical protein
MQAIIMFFLDALTLIMINPLLFNTSYIQHEIYYENELTNKNNVQDFTNNTEHGWPSELRCIDPGAWPCCIEPLTEPPDPRCLEKTKR